MSTLTNWIRDLWQRSMLHRALLVAPPVVLLTFLIYWKLGTHQGVQYYTAKVEKGDIAQVVQATGTINAVTTVQVGSQVSGNISQMFADFNSHVTKGQVIAQIDPAIFRARLQQAQADTENAQANVIGLTAQIETQKADVLTSKANVEKAQAQLDDLKLQWQRSEDLAKQGIIAMAQRDTAKSNYDVGLANLHATQAQSQQSEAKLKASVAQLDQAKAEVAQKRAAAEMTRLDLEHSTIRAPIDGTVIARNVDVGQTVAASLQAPTLFVIAQDLTKMLVYAKTDEADVGKIKVDATATFRVDSFPRETFSGRVIQVRMNATIVQNVVTYDTIIEFDNPDQKLFPGMTAYVTIPVAWESSVVKIPNGALRFKPEMTDDGRKALFAKYGIPEEPRAGGRLGVAGGAGGPGAPGGTVGAGGPGAGGGPGGSSGTTRRGGGQRGGGGADAQGADASGGRPAGATPASASQRQDWGMVWKLLPDKTLQPMRVKLGVTDFTFTAMERGDLKAGDDLVIGQTAGKNSSAQPSNPQRGGPMTGPGGIPRRM